MAALLDLRAALTCTTPAGTSELGLAMNGGDGSLVMGRANEGTPIVLIRGLRFAASRQGRGPDPARQWTCFHDPRTCGRRRRAKLANGLAAVLAPGQLTVAVNTGDDFEHMG